MFRSFGMLRKVPFRAAFRSQLTPARATLRSAVPTVSFSNWDQSFSGGGRGGGGYGGGRGGGGQEMARQQKSARETQIYFDTVNRTKHMPVGPARVSESELFGNTHSGGDMDRYKGVEVDIVGEGKDEMKTLEHFSEISGIPNFLKQNIERSKYATPSPVQKHAIEVALAGRDTIVTAQTGSGKTAAFLIPAITSMFVNAPDVAPTNRAAFIDDEGRTMPIALILAPTRELCIQIHQDAQRFTFGSPFRAAAVYGGAGAVPQLDQMANGAHIMVATPGRLADFLQRGVISLKQVRFLVMDEADRMLDMGFEHQVRDIVFKHDLRSQADGLQTLLFSATMPTGIRHLSQDFMRNIISITVGRVGAASDMVSQNVVQATNQDKEDVCMDLVAQGERTLVFVNRKANADWLVRTLNRRGHSAVAIHGDLAQRAREHSIHAFKTNRASVLVGTDVAARGLDIPDVKHVINFDMPQNIDDYIHRIGRTGRAGTKGKATSLVCRGGGMDGDDGVVKDLVKTLRDAKEEIPDWLTDYADSLGGRGGGYRGHGRSRGGSRGGYGRSNQGSSHFRDSYGSNSMYGGKREERGWNNRDSRDFPGSRRQNDQGRQSSESFDYRNRF